MKKTLITTLSLSLLMHSAFATTTFDNIIAPIAGGGGNSSTGWTTATADNGLALSLRAQYNNTVPNPPANLTPNDGLGTFTFATGTATRATWDFWFDVNTGTTTGDTFIITINSSLGGPTVTIPVAALNGLGGNVTIGTETQNSEDIGFGFIGYNPSLNATYDITLTGTDRAGDVVDTVDMTVVNGVAPVPEPTTMAAGALLLLPFGVSTLRKLRKNRAA